MFIHPSTAAVNQTTCSFAIQGRAFAIVTHSISESHKKNIKKNIGILTIATRNFLSSYF